MNGSVYLVDANIFITAANSYYAFDILPSFWNEMLRFMEEGRIRIIKHVQDEIGTGDDDLSRWFAENIRKDYVIGLDADILQAYSEVLSYLQKSELYNENAYRAWSEYRIADPWLIATACCGGYVIVTNEGYMQLRKGMTTGRPKIPNVAEKFGVRTVDPFCMMRELGFRLGGK